MVEHFSHIQVKSEGEIAQAGDVPCDVCTETKIKAHKTCLVCLASYCQTHLEPHQSLKKHKLVDPLSNLCDRVCKKHDKMLELFCCTDQECVCLMCWRDDHANHHVILCEKASREKKALLTNAISEMKTTENKNAGSVNKLKTSFQQRKKASEKDMADIGMFLTGLVTEVQEGKGKVIELIKQKQKRVDTIGNVYFAKLDQEAAEMRRERCELEQLLQTEDHLHFLLSYQRYNQTAAIQSNSIEPLDNNQPVYGEMVKKSTAQMKKTLSNHIEGLLHQLLSEGCDGGAMPKVWIPPQDELMMIQQCNAVDLTFNAFGGHISLMVSRDGKQLSLRKDRFVLSTLFGERFENLPIAFSTNSFSSGRFYYEVRVNKNQNFILGVAKESINMKPISYPTTVDGVWTFRLLFGNVYEVFDPNEIRLFLKQAPEVIGVFVDYEKGEVSFYDVEARYLMYSYKGCCFTDRASSFKALLYAMTGTSQVIRPKLYPIFGFSDDLSNPSLTITPVE